jgi:diaminopimelate epimerase
MVAGRRFWKMSGSGNDFVFVDTRSEPAGELERPATIAAICAGGTGVGADGIVFLERSRVADVGVRYLNADGSLAALCGNATLCAARLAAELGAVDPSGFALETGSGVVTARITPEGAEVDLLATTGLTTAVDGMELEPGELRAGFGVTGVPHLVIRCEALDAVPVDARGRLLRHDPRFPEGANVNWIAPGEAGEWRYRTYERGVEGETLACGTGAATCALLLRAWGETGDVTRLRTRSGLLQTIRLREVAGALRPSLGGEARLVFEGTLRELR